MDLRLLKIFRDMWGNKPRLLLVVLSIAIGVFTVGTLTRTQAIVSREFRGAYAASNPADIIINFGAGFDDQLVEDIAAIPEVKDAEGRFWEDVRVQVGPGEWGKMKLHLRADYENQRVHKVQLEEGVWPPPENTILIERTSLNILDADVGDTITLSMANGRQRDVLISGLVYDIEQVPSDFVDWAYGYVTPETFETLLGQPINYSSLQFTVTPDNASETQVREVLDLVERKLIRIGFINFGTQLPPGTHQLDDVVQAVLLVLITVGIVSLFFSAFLVIMIITAVLNRQVGQVGVMKTLGMQSRTLMLMYFGQIFLSGCLALLLAIPLSILASRELSSFLSVLLNFDIESFQVPLYVPTVEIIAGLVVPLLAGLRPISAGTKITVREAIAKAEGKGAQFGTGRIDKLFKKMRRMPESLLYAFRNILRQKVRLAFTLITLVLAGAMFISVVGTRASILLTIENLTEYWQQDVTLRIETIRLEKVKREALSVPGVVDFEGWMYTSGVRLRSNGQKSNRHVVFGIFPDSQFLTPQVTEGRWLQPEDTNAMVINLPLLKSEPDISLGDVVEYDIRGKIIRGPVVGIVTGQAVGASAFMDPIVYLNIDYLTNSTGLVGMTNQALIKSEKSDANYQNQVANAVDDHFRTIGINVSQKETNTSRRALVSNIFSVLIIILFVLAVLFVIVGGMSLTGMMSLSVLERTSEIGILRAIGGSGGFVAQIVMVEALFIGLLSWALAVLVALPLSKFLSDTIGNIILSTPLDFTFSSTGVILWLVVALVISAISAFIPARNASRLSVRETLSYE